MYAKITPSYLLAAVTHEDAASVAERLREFAENELGLIETTDRRIEQVPPDSIHARTREGLNRRCPAGHQ